MSRDSIQFEKNLEIIMQAKAYRNATDADRVQILLTFLRSDFGLGARFGLYRVKKLYTQGDDHE